MIEFKNTQELSTNSSTMVLSWQCYGTAIGQLQGSFVFMFILYLIFFVCFFFYPILVALAILKQFLQVMVRFPTLDHLVSRSFKQIMIIVYYNSNI